MTEGRVMMTTLTATTAVSAGAGAGADAVVAGRRLLVKS